jgi:Spy/CpxP family protein refolding chaperone
MTFRPAYDIPLAYGGNTVWLRPSLRAATRLEALHNGFPALLTKIQQHDTATLREIITYAATDQNAGQTLLNGMAGEPLQMIRNATIGPALALVTALMMPTPNAEPTSTHNKPIAWADLYADLFKMATGWLHWTPDTAWNATMSEILHAFEGHTDQLKAIHGSAEDDPERTSLNADQKQANIEAGLDPEFDRAGLRALKGMGKF